MEIDTMSLQSLALWFSNYSSLATKTLRPKLADSLGKVARDLGARAGRQKPTAAPTGDNAPILEAIDSLVKESIATGYPRVRETAGINRGALRAFTWGNKVATILKSVVGRVMAKGDAVLADGQSFYVCDGCGFIYIGPEAPALCPVCKAPSSRFAAY